MAYLYCDIFWLNLMSETVSTICDVGDCSWEASLNERIHSMCLIKYSCLPADAMAKENCIKSLEITAL